MSEKDKTTWRSEKTGIDIVIDRHYCKGCTICVEICPVDALKMIEAPDKWEGAEVVVKDIDACTGCMLCEVECPDFAIMVTKPEKVKKAVA
jgi:2-oxoglutarate ferredoxin oxidoreductase subunit delta